MLPTSGYKPDEIKIEKNFTFRLTKQVDKNVKKTISKYKKTPYKVKAYSTALRFMVLTFMALEDVGFFDDPVVQERYKVLSGKKK